MAGPAPVVGCLKPVVRRRFYRSVRQVLAKAELDLARTSIIAPFDGYVAEADKRAGNVVADGYGQGVT